MLQKNNYSEKIDFTYFFISSGQLLNSNFYRLSLKYIEFLWFSFKIVVIFLFNNYRKHKKDFSVTIPCRSIIRYNWNYRMYKLSLIIFYLCNEKIFS